MYERSTFITTESLLFIKNGSSTVGTLVKALVLGQETK